MNPELLAAYFSLAMMYSENPKERLNGLIFFMAIMRHINAQIRRTEQMIAGLDILIYVLEQQQ